MIYAGKVENFLTGSNEELHKDLTNIVNPKLINLVCRLIKDGVMTQDTILPYLTPDDSVFER